MIEKEYIMKYVKECAIIFGLTLAGEFLNYVLPLPVPSGVYGLFLLLILLCTGILKLRDIEATGNFLLDIMPLLFVPVSVQLIDSYGLMQSILVPVVVICIVSTVVVMVVTGKTADFMIHIRKRSQRQTAENMQEEKDR